MKMNEEKRRIATDDDELKGTARRLKTKEQCKRVKSWRATCNARGSRTKKQRNIATQDDQELRSNTTQQHKRVKSWGIAQCNNARGSKVED